MTRLSYIIGANKLRSLLVNVKDDREFYSSYISIGVDEFSKPVTWCLRSVNHCGYVRANSTLVMIDNDNNE